MGADAWEPTPWWHPRYWFGYRMRQWKWEDGYGGPYDGDYHYRTFEQHARLTLEETYGP